MASFYGGIFWYHKTFRAIHDYYLLQFELIHFFLCVLCDLCEKNKSVIQEYA